MPVNAAFDPAAYDTCAEAAEAAGDRQLAGRIKLRKAYRSPLTEAELRQLAAVIAPEESAQPTDAHPAPIPGQGQAGTPTGTFSADPWPYTYRNGRAPGGGYSRDDHLVELLVRRDLEFARDQEFSI